MFTTFNKVWISSHESQDLDQSFEKKIIGNGPIKNPEYVTEVLGLFDIDPIPWTHDHNIVV